MVKIAKYDTTICGMIMFKSRLILIVDIASEKRKIAERNKSKNKDKKSKDCKKGTIKITTCEQIKNKCDAIKDKIKKEKEEKEKKEKEARQVTCPKCGTTSEIATIIASFSRKFMTWQFLYRSITTFKGCRNCLYDYSICQNKQISKDLYRIFNYEFKNTNEVFFDKVRNDLYQIICFPDFFDKNIPEIPNRSSADYQNGCEHSTDIQCGDVLYCSICGTVALDKNCVGCGAGIPFNTGCPKS